RTHSYASCAEVHSCLSVTATTVYHQHLDQIGWFQDCLKYCAVAAGLHIVADADRWGVIPTIAGVLEDDGVNGTAVHAADASAGSGTTEISYDFDSFVTKVAVAAIYNTDLVDASWT